MGAVWIRRCRGCGADDVDATFGRSSVIAAADPVWRCRGCGHERWDAIGMAMPADWSR
jgi:hypothetical protein